MLQLLGQDAAQTAKEQARPTAEQARDKAGDVTCDTMEEVHRRKDEIKPAEKVGEWSEQVSKFFLPL